MPRRRLSNSAPAAEAIEPGNIAKADEGLSRSGSLITEAQAAAQPSRQHYFRAVALLEEAVRQEDWVEGCHRALTDRRTELNQLKSSLPQRCTKVVQRIETLGRTLHKQATDRVRANEQCREAGRLVEVAQRGLAMDRPDLLRTGKVLDGFLQPPRFPFCPPPSPPLPPPRTLS